MRLVGQCDRAAGLLARLAERAGDDWASMIDNESAALAWHSGRIDEAVDLWNRAERSPAVVFNRGMAALFLDRPADAASALSEAVAMIPEDAAWHHLARLYLTLAGLTR
jgi:predicted Zn-dependent protease